MFEAMSHFFRLATSRPVVKSAIKVALVVGTVVALINHGSELLSLSLAREQLFQILLTYLVPYCVSTYSAVRAIQGHDAQRP